MGEVTEGSNSVTLCLKHHAVFFGLTAETVQEVTEVRVAGVLGWESLRPAQRLWIIQQNVGHDRSITWRKGRFRVESTRVRVRRVKCGLVAGSFPLKTAYLCLSHTSGACHFRRLPAASPWWDEYCDAE